MIFTQFQKIMKNSTVEAKVAAYKIARDLEGLSLGVGFKALMTVLVALVCHSANPKKVADTIISVIRSAVEGVNNGNK